MKKWLSYLYPITTKIVSEYNGVLEVTWYNGKKMLNSKNANYSFGSLQKILKFGLEKTNLKQCESILLLGLGGGSVIQTLRNDFNFKKSITAIEIDPVIVEIAKDHFDIEATTQLHIICQDASKFIHENNQIFDLIIIDLFLDTEVPEQFLATKFWKDIAKASSTSAQLICNMALHSEGEKSLTPIINFLHQQGFNAEVLKKVNYTNTLVLAQRFKH